MRTQETDFSAEEWNRSSLVARYEKPQKKVVYAKAQIVEFISTAWNILSTVLLILLALIGIYMLVNTETRILLYETLKELLYQIGFDIY